MRRSILVEGRVQGVGFRYFAQEVAARLDLVGFVRNLPSGGVEIEAEGTEDALDALEQQVRLGPPASNVEKTLVADRPTSGSETHFRIAY